MSSLRHEKEKSAYALYQLEVNEPVDWWSLLTSNDVEFSVTVTSDMTVNFDSDAAKGNIYCRGSDVYPVMSSRIEHLCYQNLGNLRGETNILIIKL